MNKQLSYKIMRLMLIILTQLVNIQCLSKANEDVQIIISQETSIHMNLYVNYNTSIMKTKQIISDQFKTIENDINILKVQLTNETELRNKRAVPREQNQECVVSRRELSDLKTVIDTALINLTHTNVNCEYKPKKSNSCNELLKLVQCGINNIQNEYNKVSNDVSSKEYEKLLNAYEILNNKYIKIKDDIKALSDQKYKQLVDNLTSDMQVLAKQLRDSTDTILKKSIDLCALYIFSGNIENGIKEYHNLVDNNKILSLSSIIKKVYTQINNENKDGNIKNILTFIGRIPHKCEQFTIYLNLISKMQEENHINCYLSNFWNIIKTYIKTWNSQILGRKITECPNDYIDNFNIQLHKILQHTYRNCFPSAENSIQYIDELLTNNQKVIAYPILFQEMKTRNGLNGYEIVLLGFRIQEILMTQKSENLTKIMEIKEELPSGVNVLMSAGAIRLKNKFLDDSYFSLYNMVTSSCIESVDQEQDWIVRVHQRGRYFQFLNVANAHSLRTDTTKTFVTTGFCDRHLWELIPISNGAYFYIKNKYYGNILGVDTNSKLSVSNKNCYLVKVFGQFTGDTNQQWKIKHKF